LKNYVEAVFCLTCFVLIGVVYVYMCTCSVNRDDFKP